LVALKVQRPGIVDLIETDLLILHSLADRISATFPDLRVYNPKGMVEEFSVQIRRELDFSADGMNAERLKRNMHDLPCVLIPRIYWEFTGPRLLTMEYMEGVRIDDVDAIKAMGLDPGEIADIGFDAYIKQIFVDGFFHGDPHPGNLLVTERGEVVFLDFGIIGVLRPEKKRIFIDLLLALVNSDVDGVLKGLEKLEVNVRPEDVESVKDDLYLALLDWQTTKLEEVHFGTALEGVADTLRRYHIEVPATLMLMLKVISMVMDIGTKLEPSFRFDVKIRPYLTGLVAQSQYSLQNVADAARSARNSAENLLALPQYVNRALRMISDGTISLQLDRSNIMEIERTLDRTVDKILVGVMVAAIVVGSSLILRLTNVQVPQYILTLAALGYVIAVIVGIYAIVSAIFHGSRL
jgi:ubiquinone biosynthesis protein